VKNSKFQVPSHKESSNFKLQTVASSIGPWSLDFGTLLACAACYGKSDSPLASGMNWGIFTLLGVVLTVLTCAGVFFVHVMRGDRTQPNDSTPATPDSTPRNPTDV
jgi:hypothetical protein